MSVLATDGFAGTGALSASWTVMQGTPSRSADVLIGGTDGSNNNARYSGATWPNDQYAQVKIAAGLDAGSRYAIVQVRCAGSAGTSDSYEFYSDGASGAAHTEIAEMDNGGETVLQSISTTFTTNDIMYLEIQGTTMKARKNGVQVGSDQTDASYVSGQAGCGLYRATAGLNLDDFEGGDFTVAGGSQARSRLVWME